MPNKYILNRLISLILLSTSINNVYSWNLSALGLNASSTPVKHVTIIKNKAFLSIPRRSKDQIFTLVEATWPENTIIIPRSFPSKKLQTVGDCDSLQSVVCSDTDPAGQLYVLDVGFEKCPPKIVTYEGVTRVKVTGVISDLPNVDGSKLNNIVIDNYAIDGTRAYIGNTADEQLLIYSFREHHWWFLRFSPPAELIDFHPQKFTLQPQQIAISKNKPVLYFTSNATNYLFSIGIHHLRLITNKHLTKENKVELTQQVKFEGEKIGKSEGLACDTHNGVYYYVPQFYVLVHWNSRLPLIAEKQDYTVQQSDILPQVEQIFLDLQVVWALLGTPNKEDEHCVKIN